MASDIVTEAIGLLEKANANLEPRCRSCHQAKTERDRKAGKLTPPPPAYPDRERERP